MIKQSIYSRNYVLRLKRRIKRLKHFNELLTSDVDNMSASFCTTFVRCKGCFSLIDSVAKCQFCGHDD